MATAAVAAGPAEFASSRAASDIKADLNPGSTFWRGAPAIFAGVDRYGAEVPRHRTEVRSRWTSENLYFLFICPYEKLYLKPNPQPAAETNQLWKWDVAEVFIGSDFQDIRKYKEFEVSPQGEWVDLDIDLGKPHHEDGWTWNSGFEAAARIDAEARVWYCFMRIPYHSIDQRPPAPGTTLRVNFYRAQGPLDDHKAIAWQATGKPTYHVPEAFGILRLDK
jgi:hypothetical protein